MGFSAYQYQDLLNRQEDLCARADSRVLRRPYPVRESSTGGGLTSEILKRLLRVEKSVSMPVGTSLLLWGARA